MPRKLKSEVLKDEYHQVRKTVESVTLLAYLRRHLMDAPDSDLIRLALRYAASQIAAGKQLNVDAALAKALADEERNP